MEQKEGYHVGLIMDGNGRWATAQGEPRLVGHKAGVDAVLSIVKAAPETKVHTITLFAFAIANWKRDKEEVDGLWVLFMEFLVTTLDELLEEGVRFRLIGDASGLPENVRKAGKDAEERSKNNAGTLLQVALNYDGVGEVTRLLKRTVMAGVSPEEITSAYVLDNLDTEAGNNPDVVIRTGMKERAGRFSYWRSSAFLPLQSAQSVCVGTETLWPDFTRDELVEIITFADPDSRLFGGQR